MFQTTNHIIYIYLSFLWLLLLQLYINIKLWQEIHVISPLCGDLCDWISVGILVIRSFILSSLWRCYSQLATDIVTDDLFTFYVIFFKKKLTQWTSYCVRWKTKPTRTVDIVYITMTYQWFGVSNEFYECYHQIRNARFSEQSIHAIFAQCWTTWSKYHNVWFCIPITIPLDPHKIGTNHIQSSTNQWFISCINQSATYPDQIKKQNQNPECICGFPQMGVPQNGCFIREYPTLKWMIQGYPIFGNPHRCNIYIYT